MAALISKSTLLHLRFPFSIFLFPIFLFALAISPNINLERIIIVLVSLHFFIYPASNGFNSFYDRDENSIGGLKKPPKVKNDLIWVSIILDLIGIILAAYISWIFALFIFIYGMVSKAYSYPAIRLKKYPWISWIVAGFFQGAFAFLTCYIGINDFSLPAVLHWHVIFPALLCTVLLWANYPMTQIYQHEEDERRGDMTLSRKLGIKGTFIFSASFFLLSLIGFIIYFNNYYSLNYAVIFICALLIPIIYFLWWFYRYTSGKSNVDYTKTMALNWLSAVFLITFFIYFFLDSTNILQAF